MKKIKLFEFKSLLEKNEGDECEYCKKEKFKGWGNSTKEIKQSLEIAGEFELADYFIEKNGYSEYHPDGTNYWSKDAPVAIDFYPYHESRILLCPNCKAIFLNYIEYAGHLPQDRLRWARKSLLVENS